MDQSIITNADVAASFETIDCAAETLLCNIPLTRDVRHLFAANTADIALAVQRRSQLTDDC